VQHAASIFKCFALNAAVVAVDVQHNPLHRHLVHLKPSAWPRPAVIIATCAQAFVSATARWPTPFAETGSKSNHYYSCVTQGRCL